MTVAPRGHIGLHSHEDDPTVVYVVTGTLTNHHDDGMTTEVHAGEAFAESGPKSHWVETAGSARWKRRRSRLPSRRLPASSTISPGRANGEAADIIGFQLALLEEIAER